MRVLALLGAFIMAGLAGGLPVAVQARKGPTIYQSRHLWATINICNTAKYPHILGVRGSMPGSGRAGEAMFMRFRAQFQSRTDHRWRYVTVGADSGFHLVGAATYKARQSGWSFQFLPPAGGGGYTLRGVIDFEWRRGTRVVRHARKSSSAGHHVTAGADPPGFSAQTCVIR
jgi:hypothetical protein